LNNKNITFTFISSDVYFKKSEKKTNVITSILAKMNDNNVYFKKSEEKINKINIDDDNDLNHSSDFEEKVLEKSDNDSDSDESIDSNYLIYRLKSPNL